MSDVPWVDHKGTRYYREGVVFGYVLDGAPSETQIHPELWSHIVVRYKRKPAEVKAIQIDEKNIREIALWCGGHVKKDRNSNPDVYLLVPNIDGVQFAKYGDYVVKDENNRYFKMSEVEFRSMFEAV